MQRQIIFDSVEGAILGQIGVGCAERDVIRAANTRPL
jgi:hypothetical protein